MESQRLSQSNSIKVEPVCEDDNVQTFNRNVSEVQVFDKMESKVPACVKTEQPEVYVDYPGDDVKIFDCSQICLVQQEQSQVQNMPVFGNIDWKFVKPELSGFSKMGMASCCSIQDMSEHNTGSTLPTDTTTLAHHQEVSLISNRVENGYTASQQHENGSNTSERVSSVIEDHNKLCLTNENCHLPNTEIPSKDTHISGKSLDYTVCYTSRSTQRMQAGDTPHMSAICGVTINVDTFLHKLVTTNKHEKPYMCDDSVVSLIEVGKQNCHIRTHMGEIQYKCSVCFASFTTAGSQKYHMRIHTGEKPYKCDICCVSFTLNGHLKYHTRTHTKEKPYKCDICSASFTQTSSLKRHMRTHTREKLYKCDVCSASFTTAGNLKFHNGTHTGEKPYICYDCAKSFNIFNNLKRHLKTHTREKPYKCHVCGASFNLSSEVPHENSYRRETLHV